MLCQTSDLCKINFCSTFSVQDQLLFSDSGRTNTPSGVSRMSLHPDQLRCLVQDCIAKHLYSTAVFYADKLVTLTDYAPGDVYLLAQVGFNNSHIIFAMAIVSELACSARCGTLSSSHAPQHLPCVLRALQTYYVSRQFRRAVMLLRSHGVMDDGRFRYLAAKCLAEVDQWDECLTLLGDGELDDELQEVREGVLGVWSRRTGCLRTCYIANCLCSK